MRLSPTRRSRQRCQGGSFTIEFAIVLPILVAILFGLIDAGRFIATRTMLAQAAAAGARAACLSSTASTADITQAASDAAPALSGLTATANCTGGVPCASYPVAPGSPVEVTVSYNYVAAFYKAFGKTLTNYSLVTC